MPEKVPLCDKCDLLVPHHNNAYIYWNIYKGLSVDLETISSRHLLPVTQEGVVLCKGSPSNAQYLPDQPRDTRREYPYQQNKEMVRRAAYQKMLKLYPPPSTE